MKLWLVIGRISCHESALLNLLNPVKWNLQKQIVRALEGEGSLADLDEGVRPGQSKVYSSSEMRKFSLILGSHEDGFTRQSDNTSEYGLYPSCSSSETHSQWGMYSEAKEKLQTSWPTDGSSLLKFLLRNCLKITDRSMIDALLTADPFLTCFRFL